MIHKVLIVVKGVSRVKEGRKRRIRMKEGDQRPFSTQKNRKLGLWRVCGPSNMVCVPVSHRAGGECAVGILRASAADWR